MCDWNGIDKLEACKFSLIENRDELQKKLKHENVYKTAEMLPHIHFCAT